MKKIRIAKESDWQKFLVLAEAEGWRVPQLESNLFRGKWQHTVRILEDVDSFCGLVTAVSHQRSGWIGNLIVPQALRGRGYGSQLFAAALTALEEQGVSSVWLTASTMGQPLYERHGFVKVDEIERWVSPQRNPSDPFVDTTPVVETLVHKADSLAWGEKRPALLDALLKQGMVFSCDDSIALLQQEQNVQIIGPWYSPTQCPRANRLLLQKVLAAADPGVEVVADVLVSSLARQLLAAAGFNCAGRNALMVKSLTDGVDLGMMISLASLGSIG